jgi:monoamine oxidase
MLYRSVNEADGAIASGASQDADDARASTRGGGRMRRTLVGWLVGDAARAVSGRSPRDLLPELEDGLAPFYLQLDAHMPPGSPAWRPVACHATSWISDPYIGGSYSFPKPGAPADVTARLATPLTVAARPHAEARVPVVCFAGEATSAAFGTVGGALESGRREARRLLRAWGMGVVQSSGEVMTCETRVLS